MFNKKAIFEKLKLDITMKLLAASCLVLLSTTVALSQNKDEGSLRKVRGVIGGDVSFPLDAGIFKTGFGLAVGIDANIGKSVCWDFTTGVNYFGSSQSYYNVFVPLLTGFKIYGKEAFKGVFLETNAGASLIFANSNQHTIKFTFNPALGYHFKGGEISFRANLTDGFNYLGFRLAGNF